MAMLNSQRVANISISTVSIPFHHTSPYFPMSLIVKSQQSQRLEESYPHSFMILTYFNHVFQSHTFQCLPIFFPTCSHVFQPTPKAPTKSPSACTFCSARPVSHKLCGTTGCSMVTQGGGGLRCEFHTVHCILYG